MGIRNERPVNPTQQTKSAHYPSWGLGMAEGSPTFARVPRSLPLMGIRNMRDLEQMVLGRPSSLPLMGIRNAFAPGIIPLEVSQDSLPLMGIRNMHKACDSRSAQSPHYPSWGLGIELPILKCPAADHSLPLMGIRNSYFGHSGGNS